jgi:hypothetical protein
MAKHTLAASQKRYSDHSTVSTACPRFQTETAQIAFRAIPVEGLHLLNVAEGVECETARREAADLEDAVRRLLAGSIETGTDGSAAYLCEFALDVARALRAATEHAHEGNFIGK